MQKKQKSRSRLNIRQSTVHLAVLGLLTALCAVLAMFTFRPNEMIKISLTFIPVCIAAYLYGAPGAGAVAGLADIINWMIKPMGPLYPPITVTEIVIGIVFGLLLHRKSHIVRVVLSAGITQFLISGLVTPLWLHLLYGMNYPTLLMARIPQLLIMFVSEVVVITIMLKALEKIKLTGLLPGLSGTKERKSKSASAAKD